MEKRYTVAVVFGTRPEAIKLIPIVHALQKVPVIRVRVYSTGQHREMLEQVLSLFDLNVDCDFHVMTQNQTLAGMTEAILHCSTEVFLKDRPCAGTGRHHLRCSRRIGCVLFENPSRSR